MVYEKKLADYRCSKEYLERTKMNLELGVIEEDYQESIRDTSKRQDFINRINLGKYAQFIKSIKYYPSISNKEQFCMQTYNSLLTFLKIRGLKSKISVFGTIFSDEIHQNVFDFYSTLVYHEGFHAKEIFGSKIGKWNHSYLEGELRAYQNVEANLSNNNSDSYILHVLNKIDYLKISIDMCKIFNRRTE